MRVIFSKNFDKAFSKLDKSEQTRILNYLNEIEGLENPRSRGKPLKHNFAGLWRYRVGNYRILCRIMDSELVISALEIGHRREIYKP